MADTVLPARECYWQIQCYQECYQQESVIGRYSVTSQRFILANTVIQGVLPARERIDQSESVIGRYSVISQKVLLSHSVTRQSFIGRYSVTRIVTSQRVLLAETVLLVTVLLADTLLPGVLPVRDFYWQIHCYQSEVFFSKYSITGSATCQKVY